MAKSNELNTSYVLNNNNDQLGHQSGHELGQFPVENIDFTLPENIDSSLLHVLLTSSSSSTVSSQSPYVSPMIDKTKINKKEQQKVSFILDQKGLSSSSVENTSIATKCSVIEQQQQMSSSLSSYSKTLVKKEEQEENQSTSVVKNLSFTLNDVLVNLSGDGEESTTSIEDDNGRLLEKTTNIKRSLLIDSTNNNKKYPSKIIPRSILRKTISSERQEKNFQHHLGSNNNDDSNSNDSDYYVEEESEDDCVNGENGKRKNNEKDNMQQHIGDDRFFVQTNNCRTSKTCGTSKKKGEKTREEHYYYYSRHRQNQPSVLIEKAKKEKIIINEDNAWLLKKSSFNYQSSIDNNKHPNAQPSSSKQSVTFVDQPKTISTTSTLITNPSYLLLNDSCSSLSTSVKYSADHLSKPDYLNMRDFIPSTTASSTANDFKPVYVSPLKYRPLVGLSAQDSRLLLEKRVSLLGKPILIHPIQRRSPNYRRTQSRIHNFLERPRGYKAGIYHTLVFVTVFLCLFLSVIVTMPQYEDTASTILLHTEICVVIWLTAELSLRIWSSGCRSRYQTFMGRLRFMKKPLCALDLTVVVATAVTLCLNSRGGSGVFAASALRGLRFFQILRMLRMDRRGGTWKLLGSVVYAHRQELITTIYIGFLVLIFSSFIMFLVEKDAKPVLMQNLTTLVDSDRHKFDTYADALWWGIVGYGDRVPSSNFGKLIAAVCSLIGISFFALPAGILGSGFALKVQQQQRQKHYKRRKIPAVLLIQNLWRVYAADEKSLSQATWKVHVKPRKEQSTAPFRRKTPNTTQPIMSNNTNERLKQNTVVTMRSGVGTRPGATSLAQPSALLHDVSSSDAEDDHTFACQDISLLTLSHKNAIRFIRKVKYFVCRRKFREALRPYDVTDVIEQYSTGNVDMLARMKYLQLRLDKVLGTAKSADSYESGLSLASRIVKIERLVEDLDVKVDKLCQLANNILENRSPRYLSTIVRAPIRITPRKRRFYRCLTHIQPHNHQQRPPPSSSFQSTPCNSREFTRANTDLPNTITSTVARTTEHNRPPSRTIHTPRLSAITLPTVANNSRSRDSLISLYWLFNDNINSSRTAFV
ncbi:unnamed protein product [Didymodactylos carnosus]|uniref:Uncharacterized protein n=1 Tax=Didymodactylos carnosus TaxID=1234261 RepID=A0A813X961_9BILA|nr:unnamed protein product [Didymodactylos carnosus]CAF3659757.1 unnamed protein product [Didymodactylos carnosus]